MYGGMVDSRPQLELSREADDARLTRLVLRGELSAKKRLSSWTLLIADGLVFQKGWERAFPSFTGHQR